jgi:hypothetical protein
VRLSLFGSGLSGLGIAYLLPPTEDNYSQIKLLLGEAKTHTTQIGPGQGGVVGPNRTYTFSAIALAYGVTAQKYGYSRVQNDFGSSAGDGLGLDSWLTSLANLAVTWQPGTMVTGDTNSDYISDVAGFLGVMTRLYTNRNPKANCSDAGDCWAVRTKCMLRHSATKYLSEDFSIGSNALPGCIYHTQNLYNANDIPPYGRAFDGRYDNHNYGPNPNYVYGNTLGETALAAVGLGVVQNNSGCSCPSFRYVVDNLWSQHLYTIDFQHNLWNAKGDKITKLNDPNQATNIFKKYAKSDSFADPANGMNGLIMGAMLKNDYSSVDQLVNYIWYAANDYGVFPYDYACHDGIKILDVNTQQYIPNPNCDITPSIDEDNWTNRDWHVTLIYPAAAIERYVVSLMLLESYNLPALP